MSLSNVAPQMPMELSQGQKIFPHYFFAFLKFTSNFEYFEKNDESHSLSISDINDSERGGYLNV